MTNGKIIAFGLLTERDLAALGPAFSRAWPVDEAPCFAQLLDAIDEADRVHRLQRPSAADDHERSEMHVMEANPIGDGRR